MNSPKSPPPDMDLDALVKAAADARANSYARYSGFRVGAALLGDDGTIYRGVNVESASFPVGVCAEQTAVCSAVTQGARRFVAIAVVTDAAKPAFPCGICRQALYEFNPDLLVVVENPAKARLTTTLRELLPHGFGPGDFEPRPGLIAERIERSG